MIKYRFKQLLVEKEYNENRKIKYEEITRETGISRQTLSKIAAQSGYQTSTANIEKLCRYFACTPNDLMEIMDEPTGTEG